MLFKVFKLEGSQEPERAEMEGHHRRDGLLEERGGVEEGPVSAETDYEVDLVRQIVLLFVERHQLVAHLKKGHEMMKKRSRIVIVIVMGYQKFSNLRTLTCKIMSTDV